jgi:hypothetical protein
LLAELVMAECDGRDRRRASRRTPVALRIRAGHHDPVKEDTETVVLWRPTGPEELALVEASGWREWPPRLPEQPIFCPVLNKEYATQIARDWNVPASDSGYVTRFEVRRSFLSSHEVHRVGGESILEYWIPAEDLPALNASIVGRIELVAEYY